MIYYPLMKILLILLLALPAYTQVKVNYDKFKDQTIIATDEVRLDPITTLTVKGLHKGEKSDDVQFYFLFRSHSRSWLFLKSHGLIFLADGVRYDLGDGSHDGEVTRYANVRETMIYRIGRRDLETFAKASVLEMKLGGLEKTLDEKDKKGMKEILEYK